MKPIFSCECTDGRIITGSPKWLPDELNSASPLQLAAIASEQRDFARYYTTHFFVPIRRLQNELENLRTNYQKSRTRCLASGIIAGVLTLLWLMFALAPALRFSGITLCLTLMTLGGILVFIPMLLSLLTAQEELEKRRPRIRAKLGQITQKQEQMVYGKYLEYVISGFLISPEYCLQEDAMDYFLEMLNSHRATNLAEADLLCRKKFKRATVPAIITRMRMAQEGAPQQKVSPAPAPAPAPAPIVKEKAAAPAVPKLPELIQLSDSLNTALHAYADSNKTSGAGMSMQLTDEESVFLSEFRSLNAQEQLRIRRIVRSFRTGTI